MASINGKEINISVSGARIIAAEIVPNGTCNIMIETVSTGNPNTQNIIVLVEASKLRVDDEFMKYVPKTLNEKNLKTLITESINKGVKDFYRPIIDPAYCKNTNQIEFEFGLSPAIGFSYDWWEKESIGVNQVRNSRLGTKYEYASFLGIIIKELVHNGWKIEEAWNSVCNNSKELGHYRNSVNSNRTLESIGSRKVWTWFDLGNVRKILAMDKEKGGFWFVGGSYKDTGSDKPLACFEFSKCTIGGNYDAVGWIVYEK